ncbi:MAG: phosphate signaling complex protein PhoU [Candidatus Marinimicrobia bacterium]|nr:phosphate signaling complex protein PhoU [Candidatus Neomarinimicrobiota bacterium]
MNRHLFHEIELIKQSLLRISAMAEEAVKKSVFALTNHNLEYALEVIKNDELIDHEEVILEENCLKVLALHQPVAMDLRYIVSTLKINNDLERIGDLAVNIAKLAVRQIERSPAEIPAGITSMAKIVQDMLKSSLDAMVKMNTKKARKVCQADEEVDILHKDTFGYVEKKIRRNPEQTGDFLILIGISRYLERIADHATNIAEDVIYMVEGEISRHSNSIF